MHLLLDSSGNFVVAGLASAAGELLAETMVASGTPESRDLSAIVNGLMEKVGQRDIDRVVVGCGPGTFIGTRMAVSFANGYAAASGAELVGASSLGAIAAVETGPCTVLRDARGEHMYVYGAPAGGQAESQLVPLDNLATYVSNLVSGNLIVERAKPGDSKAAARISRALELLGAERTARFVDHVPAAGLLNAGAGQPVVSYTEPEYCKGFI